MPPKYSQRRKEERKEETSFPEGRAPEPEPEKKYQCAIGETLRLPVVNGVLMGVPSAEQGTLSIPYEDGNSWLALLVPTYQDKFDRRWFSHSRAGGFYTFPSPVRVGNLLEFGVNFREEDDPFDANGFSPATLPSRRWYGVVREAIRKPSVFTGDLVITRARSIKGAYRLAVTVCMEEKNPTAQDAQLDALLSSFKAGDTLALVALRDWLEQHEDTRGEALREGLMELVLSLFPETIKPTPKPKKV